jgi:hypothetical protein
MQLGHEPPDSKPRILIWSTTLSRSFVGRQAPDYLMMDLETREELEGSAVFSYRVRTIQAGRMSIEQRGYL